MNSKLIRIAGEAAIAIIVSVALSFVPLQIMGHAIDLAILPLLFLAFRQGLLPGLLSGLIFGLVNGLIVGAGNLDWLRLGLDSILAYTLIGVAGIFARNTVRTAFNRRKSSTVLNVTTGTLLASLLSWVTHVLTSSLTANTFLSQQQADIMSTLSNTWLTWCLTAGLAILIFVLLAYILPTALIPKQTRFLTRREQSHLLND